MKKVFKLLISILCFLPFVMNVKAVCNDKELNDFVEKLEIKFLAPSKKEDYDAEFLKKHKYNTEFEYAYFFYLSEKEYKGEGIEKVVELEAYDGAGVKGIWKYHESIAKYAVGGYNGVKEEEYKLILKGVSGSCKGEILKTTSYIVPQFNMYRQTAYCEKYPEHELCARFTDATKDMNDAQFGKAMAEYERSINPQNNKWKDLILKYYAYVLCAVVPAIIVAIYYRRRINRYIKLRNREEDRHVMRKKKAGLFIILFLLLITNVRAQSTECPIKVVTTRTIATIPGTKVSVNHCGWGGGGWGTVASGHFDGLSNAGGVPYYASVSTCGGDHFEGYLRRCVTRKEMTINRDDTSLQDANPYLDGLTDKYAGAENLESAILAGEKASHVTIENGKVKDLTLKDGNGYVEEGTHSVKSTGTDVHDDGQCCMKYELRTVSNYYPGCEKTNSCSSTANVCVHYGQLCHDVGCDEAGKECSKEFSTTWGGRRFDGTDEGDATYEAECPIKAKKMHDDCVDAGWASCTLEECEQGSSDLKCPSYPCEATTSYVEPTIDTYDINQTDAFCVNPGSPAGSSYNDVEIDVNKCASSNSSVDCGFANILVEAKYHNKFTVPEDPTQSEITEPVIALATRLWGAYTNQGGYNTTGLGTYTGADCTVDLDGSLGAGSDALDPASAFKTCYEMIYLKPGTKIPSNTAINVYRQTVEKMLSLNNVTDIDLGKYETLSSVEIKDAKQIFKGIKCDVPDPGKPNVGSGDGVICSQNTPEMSYALALFFNTKNGNKHLKDHLNKLYGGLSVIPVNISISSQSQIKNVEMDMPEEVEEYCEELDENGTCKISKTIINIDYSEEITEESKRIDCSKLDELVKNKTITQEQADTISNYCNVKVKEIRAYHPGGYTEYTAEGYRECIDTGRLDENNMVVYNCNTKFTRVDNTISEVTACQKSTCIVQTKIYADCSMSISKIQAIIQYKGSQSVKGIKKYVSCNSPNPEGDINNQFLFKIEEYDKIKPVDVPDDTETILEATVNCNAECQDMHTRRTKQECDYPQYSSIVGTGRKSKGSYSIADGVKSYETSIHDPSLSCILHASPMDKVTYDYSDYFGVNTDICRIYCSDSVHYYLPDKTVTYAGLNLKYDIEFGTSLHNEEYGKYRYSLSNNDSNNEYIKEYRGKNKSKQFLTSIIEMRRDCVSEIYYDNLSNGKKFSEIASRYGFTKDSDAATFREIIGDKISWKGLYDAVLLRSDYHHNVLDNNKGNPLGRENRRNEILTKLIYDLYNCNLYSEIPIAQPKDNTVGPIYENVIKKYYSENFGFEDCELNDDKNTCIGFEGMTYNGGAKYAKDSAAVKNGSISEVGDARDSILYKYTLELNPKNPKEDKNNPRISQITNVRYCKGADCFSYLTPTKFYKEPGDGDNTDTLDITEGSYLLPYARKKTVNIEYDGESKTDEVFYYTNTKEKKERDIPINDYAYFTVSTKVGFYNVSKFQAEEYTGDVYDVTDEKNYMGESSNYREEVNKNRTSVNENPVNKGLYPVAVTPNECAVVENSKTASNYYACEHKSYAGETNTYYRNFGKGNGTSPKTLDKFYDTINNDSATTFTCYFISKYALDDSPQVIFRNIELKDFFPIDRTVGKNWATEPAQKYVNETERYVDANGTLQYYDKHLEYSYTLTQSTIKKIREYNEKIRKYTNPYTEKPNGSVSDNRYHSITSKFLEAIDTGEEEIGQLGIINNMPDKMNGYGYVRGVSEYTHELRDKKD